LLKQIGGTAVDAPLITTHAFLYMCGLLQATLMAHVAQLDVLWCEPLCPLNFLDMTRETLEWLPWTLAVMYVWAGLWSDVRGAVEAAEALDNLAGRFDTLSLLIAPLPQPTLI